MSGCAAMAAPGAGATLAQWLAYLGQIHVTAIDLGLARLRPVAQALDLLHPQAHVVTVAGTNGKGSTTMTLACMYEAAGYRVGLYQSPHVYRFNERIRVQGAEADDAQIIAALAAVEQARQQCGVSLSFFESTTLAAWWVFRAQGCQVWVLEVGLGGRLDAVNLIDPDVAVITSIGLDHTEWLGDTLEQIAFEKAGIMRPGIPVVYADPESCPQAILTRAEQLGAQLIRAGVDYCFQASAQGLDYSNAALSVRLPLPHLAAVNVAGAVSAVLAGKPPVPLAALEAGIRRAQLPGRLQVLSLAGRTLVCDVAHNAHGMRFLRRQLQARGLLHDGQPVRLVFSMLADKDIAAVVAEIAPWVSHWDIAELHTPRAATQAQLLQALAGQSVQVHADLQAALHHALDCSPPGGTVVACGSFHVLEALQPALSASHHDTNSNQLMGGVGNTT